MADTKKRCPTCHSIINDPENGIIGTWGTSDPILTPVGLNGTQYKGFTRIEKDQLVAIQNKWKSLEQSYLPVAERTNFNPITNCHLTKTQIKQIRQSIEKVWAKRGFSLTAHFNYADDMIYSPLKSNWTDSDWDKYKGHIKGIHIEELRCPGFVSPSFGDILKTNNYSYTVGPTVTHNTTPNKNFPCRTGGIGPLGPCWAATINGEVRNSIPPPYYVPPGVVDFQVYFLCRKNWYWSYPDVTHTTTYNYDVSDWQLDTDITNLYPQFLWELLTIAPSGLNIIYNTSKDVTRTYSVDWTTVGTVTYSVLYQDNYYFIPSPAQWWPDYSIPPECHPPDNAGDDSDPANWGWIKYESSTSPDPYKPTDIINSSGHEHGSDGVIGKKYGVGRLKS